MDITIYELEQEIEELNKMVLPIYERIFLLPPEESRKAMDGYIDWKSKNCTREQPCAECIRDYKIWKLSYLMDKMRCQKSLLRLKRGRWGL